ncbi:MAG: hypothetical protein WDO70_11960 [Alphaproteobacteria bacterium]
MLNVSTGTYLTLCALVRDAMQVESDASPMLARVARELSLASHDVLPSELKKDTRKVAALAEAGFIRDDLTFSAA